MALSKLTYINHLKTLIIKTHHRYPPPPKTLTTTIRHLSFATPEDAAAERRRRKRRLRIEPPLNSLRNSNTQTRPTPSQTPNPNTPKLPEHVSVLTGTRLTLHNRILKLIRENDLTEAVLLTRHSVYSNCKPTIFTVNAVMNACLRQAKYAELLNLHRFITQAAISANIVTYNLVITTYLECRKVDTALEHYKQLVENAPFEANSTTYRVLVKGLVDNGKLDMVNLGSYNVVVDGYCGEKRFDDAIKVFNSMGEKRCYPDTLSFNNLIEQLCENGLLGKAEETMVEAKLRPNLGVYNQLMDGLVKVGKVDEAKAFFDMMVPKLRMDDDSYKFIMKALFDIKKHDEVLEIIGKMLREEPLDFSEELVKLMADVEREKAEAAAKAAEEAERAKASTRAAVSSLLPSRLFGDKVDEENEEGNKVGEENVEENVADGEGKVEEDDASGGEQDVLIGRGGMALVGLCSWSLIKGYFLRGMEDEAMRCFEEVFGDGSKYGGEAGGDRRKEGMNEQGKKQAGERVVCWVKAEEVYNSMSEKSVNPDEFTFVVLMDTCFKEGRPDDAAGYFKTMVEAKLRPNLGVYSRLMDGLVKVGKGDEAKGFFDMMVPKLRMDDDSYKFIMKALFDIKKHDEVLEIIGKMLREEPLDFSDELQEFVREELRKEEKEEELVKLMADVEREKAEAAAKAAEEAERAKASTRAAVSSRLLSRLFGDKVDEENEEGNKVGEENVEENVADGEGKVEADDASGGEQVNA
ncbi:pentatricopeptide repeat-containing protein [Tanacetum coccineum]